MPRPHYLLFGILSYVLALRSMIYLVPFLANRGVEKSIDSGPAGPQAAALGLDLALLLGFAMTHSLLARRSAKSLLLRVLPAGLQTSFFSFVAGLQMTALLLFWRPLPAPVWSVRTPLGQGALWALFALGWAIVVIGFTTLRNARLFGLEQASAAARGRPAEPDSLRVVGIYRYLRHPLYAGTILSLWSTPEMSVGHLLLAIVFTVYILIGRRLEERDLAREHGERWHRYRTAVPPFLPRWPGAPRRSMVLRLLLVALLLPLPAAAAEPVHGDWTAVLGRFVDERGFVDYLGLARDRALFDRYVARIERHSPDSDPTLFPDRDHELAYWINAYNAMVFRGVLERGPEIDSVWGEGWFGLAFFTRRDFSLGGRRTSLKELEDDIVRARYGDPRVHAALNCASRSCPRLPRQAFDGARLDEQLDAAMREFVREPGNCSIDFERRTVRLSRIFDWFDRDFLAFEKARGAHSPSVIDYLNRFRPRNGKIPAGFRVRYLEYDKRLNRQETPE